MQETKQLLLVLSNHFVEEQLHLDIYSKTIRFALYYLFYIVSTYTFYYFFE